MKVPESVREDYERWSDFLRRRVRFNDVGSTIHTRGHCARVLLFALLIADRMGLPQAERDALGAAAVFHDSRRLDDGYDVGHGARAAAYYRGFCARHGLPFDERTAGVMAWHDRDDYLGEEALAYLPKGVLLYRIFKDADALDRFRFADEGPDLSMLRTREGKDLVAFAEKWVREDLRA